MTLMKKLVLVLALMAFPVALWAEATEIDVDFRVLDMVFQRIDDGTGKANLTTDITRMKAAIVTVHNVARANDKDPLRKFFYANSNELDLSVCLNNTLEQKLISTLKRVPQLPDDVLDSDFLQKQEVVISGTVRIAKQKPLAAGFLPRFTATLVRISAVKGTFHPF